ncbi:MAG: DNA topoisomerase I [Bacteroidetes bacterium GWE2_39_28]|nr:MAG: DNA topoisomerase I [Bacteroidetes bacterium GWE2_39_28]OFY11868.1 MAG: DNA topoisomerase I [Bacteroidetes bacterium GWF2_39_10]OFZ09430.1 MAG: DNA topoisomerase I [Bacteroidetes bacterium RIFOXYB2_FULL_39_7]OFZ11355.1 MAG: DNA topoisomerase I [Bacteroidetes bacterium RIFOXYC2_FULL_39_11]HCT95216.1 type I DNA topoisomerase [Rikenellaceae bacterium]
MGENLVIVESPAKAKTIEKFLGSSFTVKSSFGHIRDLSKKNLGIDIENGFEPDYLISDDKKKVVSELKSLAKKAETVWLASDEDREGEAIAWHLFKTLELKPEKTKRIVFHEITKEAILHAIENPRAIDMNLVMAQQARRVLDRLVGFELSPVLWKKVRPKLSAGRVQSVALRLIVERERDIQQFAAKSQFKIEGVFNPEGQAKTVKVAAEISERFDNEATALEILKNCNGAQFNIGNIEEKESKRTPPAPFTTSTLQQEASRKLGFSLSQTMRSAQNLYESGYITYMRTDSVNLSKMAIAAAKQVITDMYGKEYSKTRQYATKSKGAQEAHEAIRPSYMSNIEVDASPQDKRLYNLIWKRTLASQMSDATIQRTQITIVSPSVVQKFEATADRVTFDGFLKVYMESKDDDSNDDATEMLLPALKEGQKMNNLVIKATEKFTQKPPRYTEASLVKKLEELGIGRPSTYAPTISTLSQRGYIVKDNRPGQERSYREIVLEKNEITSAIKTEMWGVEKSKLFPEDIGIMVNDFLVDNFQTIIDYNFTAGIEEDFDLVAEGKLVWNTLISNFYKPFHLRVDETLSASRPANTERVLGADTKTGKKVLVRIGRFGPLAQIGENDDPEKRFMSLAKGQLIETITLEEALRLFDLPRVVGTHNGEEIVCAIGRFGPYIRYKGSFISLGKDNDPHTISLEKCITLIDEHSSKEAKKSIKSFAEDGIEILNGRFGAYIKKGKNNYKIPKGVEPESIDLEKAIEIIAKADTGGKTRKKK